MQFFIVGGAVRDALLGLPITDRDWVVVGARPSAMRDAGFVPVGNDFPVFLHPVTKEEYALARTERKTAPGYRGFEVDAAENVSLEDDLKRRDLTINAMARTDDGTLIDPWGGERDLRARVLRHVSPAFAEDPVRILRLARFAARFPEFTVADETLALATSMVAAGEVDALVPERVWQEFARGLMEARPARMFEVLRACGALARLLPEVDRLWGVPQRADHHPEIDTGVHLMMVLDMAARLGASLPVRFACLGHDLGKGTTPADVLPRHLGHEQRSVELVRGVSERLRVPAACRELAEVVAREHGNVHRSAEFGAAALVRLFERCDAIRRPERFDELLLACECDARGRLGAADAVYAPRERLRRALDRARAVDSAAVAAAAAARGLSGPAVGQAIHDARVQAVAAAGLGAPGP
ncbi:MAG TPA: multifunctional CCA addition/repair protein [Burkholderiaceae bacterium]|nr:multifunctional CCA addition/repair protein [Burkholderiaceae bacterium]